MVTAELAIAIPIVVLVLAGLIGVLITVGAQLGCVDAAREAARAAARGEPPAVVQAIVSRIGPDGATASVSKTGDTVTVTVRAHVAPLGGALGTWTVQATAVARLEPELDEEGRAWEPP